MALAKLGDEALQTRFIDEYRRETDPRQKWRLAHYRLAYIGSELCCRTLAEDLRTPLIYVGANRSRTSFRVMLVEALRHALPDEPLPSKEPKDNSYYAEIEKWAEERYGVVWKRPRPEFFHPIPAPVRPYPIPQR